MTSRANDDLSDPAVELVAALDACVLVDRSSLLRLLGTGPDLLDLLNRLSTADLRGLAAGQGRATVLTTSKGRIVERLFVHHLGDEGLLLVGGAGAGPRVLAQLRKYTFAEKTGLADTTAESCQFALLGPRAGEALATVFDLPEPHRTESVEFGGAPAWVLGHDGLSADGFSVVAPRAAGPSLRQKLLTAVAASGGRAAGPRAAEAYRILRGIPAADHELTEAYNPLEAGLGDAVSFEKGCYVGQEVVARLNNYDKVSRRIIGLRLPAGSTPPDDGTPLFHDGRSVGEVTSATIPPGFDAPVALAYVKHRALPDGVRLSLGSADAPADALPLTLPFPEAT